jgi:ribosomal protein S27AE
MAPHFINLNCANCGAKLDVHDDMERFACGYCGTEMIVQRRGGTVTLKALTAAISKVQIGTDKTAAELAIARHEKEMAQLLQSLDALKKRRDGDVATCLSMGLIASLFGYGFGGFTAAIFVAVICILVSYQAGKFRDPKPILAAIFFVNETATTEKQIADS